MSSSTPDRPSQRFAGIDVGGTKIEASLFDANMHLLSTRRLATPHGSYADLRDVLLEEIALLRQQAGAAEFRVGIGLPGVLDRETGQFVTANLVANGFPLRDDLRARTDIATAMENDCRCFALSEANGGAGEGHARMFGLIIGTGLGGGMCEGGRLSAGLNGVAGEIGHLPLPAHLVEQRGIPLLQCSCGRTGCFETVLSGPGLQRLHHARTGDEIDVPELARREAAGGVAVRETLDIWTEVAGELLRALQLYLDPECIVVGGGLSNLPGVAERLSGALRQSALVGLEIPQIAPAKFGDRSGSRGAAILARQTENDRA